MANWYARANKYLSKIRKICNDKTLSLSDVHIILQELGCKKIPNTENQYSQLEADQKVENQKEKIKDIYRRLIKKQEPKPKNKEFKHTSYVTDTFFPKHISDMAKASDELLKKDEVYYGEHRPQYIKEHKRNIFITETQAKQLEEKLLEENSKYPVNPNKVRVISNYLDDNFTRGGISTFSEDGYPKTICIVAMKGTDGNVAKNLDAKQLFYLLQDKFKNIYLDKSIRDRFIKQVMKDWFNKKITKQFLLSVNNF